MEGQVQPQMRGMTWVSKSGCAGAVMRPPLFRERFVLQSKRHSFLEASANTGIGFVISWAMWEYVASPLFHIPSSAAIGFWMTMIFTVTSIIRSYGLRRLFNWYHHRSKW